MSDVTSGRVVSFTDVSSPITPFDLTDELDSGGNKGETKSLSVMSAEAYLKSQDVAWLAETNQVSALKPQRED